MKTVYYCTCGFSIRESNFIFQTLNDEKSWSKLLNLNFEEVSREKKHHFEIKLMPGKKINEIFKDVLELHGLSVCDRRTMPYKIYISKDNWDDTPVASGYKNKQSYRVYVILHEVGHALGYDHAKCPGLNQPAPVMMQQTLGTGLCYPEPWVIK
jgi:Zn-dependent M32 family carboxypeptidase